MHDAATLVLAILGAVVTWTASVVSLVIWLTGKFRTIEQLVYTEMHKHRRDDAIQFDDLQTRTQRLEYKAFGFSERRAPLEDATPPFVP